jgi:hypothetical protein
MPRVHIDISLFTRDAAFGMVSGPLDLAIVPQVGDIISFRLPASSETHVGKNQVPFCGQLRITERIITADPNLEVSLALEDITAGTSEAARNLMQMFEQHHGLFGDVWGE